MTAVAVFLFFAASCGGKTAKDDKKLDSSESAESTNPAAQNGAAPPAPATGEIAARVSEPPSEDDPIADMESARDEICACEDKACAEVAMEKMKKLAEKYQDVPEPPADDIKRIQAAMTEMMGCLTKLVSPDPGKD